MRRPCIAGTVVPAALLAAMVTGCSSARPAEVEDAPRVAPVARVERRWSVMGTYAGTTVFATTREEGERAVERIQEALAAVDASMSNWKPESGLCVLNREAAMAPFPVADPALFRCIASSLEHAHSTEGTFDPTVGPLMKVWGFRPGPPKVPPTDQVEATRAAVGHEKVRLDGAARTVQFAEQGMELDLGGIAKGCALDLVATLLSGPPVVGALVDLGGNLYALGAPPGETGWTIGLREPSPSAEVLATVAVRDRFVSTSSNSENFFVEAGRSYGHLMDPRTGRPADTDVLSATVFAAQGAGSDALSTALFVAGSARAASILERHPGVEAVLLVRDRGGPAVLASRSLEGRLRVVDERGHRIGPLRFELPPAAAPPPP